MADLQNLPNKRLLKPQTGDDCVRVEYYDADCLITECLVAELQLVKDQIALGAGGGGGTGTTIANVCGPVGGVSANTAINGNVQCNGTVEVGLTLTGANGDNNAGATASATGNVAVYCDGVQIGLLPYALVASNLNNDQSYSESQTLNFTTTCVGVITTGFVGSSQSTPGSNGTFNSNACINANCI